MNTGGPLLRRFLLKVRLSRNEFMKSAIFQNSNFKISALKGYIFGGKLKYKFNRSYVVYALGKIGLMRYLP